MNDNNILACIEYAKENNLACADEAMEDYKKLVSTSVRRPTKREADLPYEPACNCGSKDGYHPKWCACWEPASR